MNIQNLVLLWGARPPGPPLATPMNRHWRVSIGRLSCIKQKSMAYNLYNLKHSENSNLHQGLCFFAMSNSTLGPTGLRGLRKLYWSLKLSGLYCWLLANTNNVTLRHVTQSTQIREKEKSRSRWVHNLSIVLCCCKMCLFQKIFFKKSSITFLRLTVCLISGQITTNLTINDVVVRRARPLLDG